MRRRYEMRKRKQALGHLIISITGVFITLYAVIFFNQHLLMTYTLETRMVLMILGQWILFLVPGILMWRNRERIADFGFRRNNIFQQIVTGIVLALIMSLVLTVIPILLGFEEMVSGSQYTKLWQFLYEFGYTIIGVALVEELIFRGYIFNKLLELKDNRMFAILASSVIFGFFHIFNGNLIQVLVTTIIGIIYCVLREKVPSCTTLSLIVLHGVYDALITVWVFVL